MSVLFFSPVNKVNVLFSWQKVPVALLRRHSVQGLYGTHLAGIAICPSIHLPVKWILYNPYTG